MKARNLQPKYFCSLLQMAVSDLCLVTLMEGRILHFSIRPPHKYVKSDNNLILQYIPVFKRHFSNDISENPHYICVCTAYVVLTYKEITTHNFS